MKIKALGDQVIASFEHCLSLEEDLRLAHQERRFDDAERLRMRLERAIAKSKHTVNLFVRKAKIG